MEKWMERSGQAVPYVPVTDMYVLADRNKERALALWETYDRDFYIPEKGYLKLFHWGKDKPEHESEMVPATCWEYGALMSMQSQLAIMDERQIDRLREINDNLDYYGYCKDGALWGYVVNRGEVRLGAADPGLAYDDTEWLVINFLRSYEVTKDAAYLEKAEALMNFVLEEAWFEPLGGLFWDTRHEARHSCSNNPAVKPLVDLYRHSGKRTYLDWAVKIFDFSLTLKHTELNIYEDLVHAKLIDGKWREGVPGGGRYTYNTGTMISAAAALYEATGDERYLREALLAAKGAYDYFARETSANVTEWPCSSNIWFNNILLRGYIDLYDAAPEKAECYIMTFQCSMDYAYEHWLRDGYLPVNWAKGWGTQEREKDNRLESLDHSANVEMYAMLANWQKKRIEKA